MHVTFSRDIKNIPFIESFIGDKLEYYSKEIPNDQIKGVVGWGLKKTARKARKFARENSYPYISLEDGFICSYGLRVKGYPPLSLIVDPVGIYYDAKKPSLLENLLNERKFDKNSLIESEKILKIVLDNNISKFNYQPNADTSIFKGKRSKRVLVIDQTYNDLSVVLGLANKESFLNMLKEAKRENQDADIYVKIHPDVIYGKKKGYLSEVVEEKDNIYLIKEDLNPLSLLRYFDKVYTVSSQMGFEAILLGKPVTCFGMPFYAGWGLTEDKLECPRRKQKLSLIEIFYASYIKYCVYINPKTGKRGNILDVINFIIRQREINQSIGAFDYYCVDFHLARKKFIKPYLKTEKNRVFFIRSSSLKNFTYSQRAAFVVWGNRNRKRVLEKIQDQSLIITVEDGFIRSYGLGSEFTPPFSLVFDKRGIYYNPNEESELEYILNNYEFSQEDIERAERIRKLIIENSITKYNIETFKSLSTLPYSKKILLVPGQVEDDEAVILSGGKIKTNLQLLETVRMRNPDSFIIYKVHPDVISKNRRRDVNFDQIKKIADHIETEADIISCINVADEVHTLTSLSGFDGLLRGKKVFTYGGAFYAGWGLTKDELVFPRRKRNLTLQELIAGTLIVYPSYYDWYLKGFVDCETIINRIIYERAQKNRKIIRKYPSFIKKLLNYINFVKWAIKND